LSSAVRNFSLPSPEEIKNSNFVKSFNQPLMVKSKVQRPTTQQSNAVLLMEKTPAELSKISKLSDFPLPNLHFKKKRGKNAMEWRRNNLKQVKRIRLASKLYENKS